MATINTVNFDKIARGDSDVLDGTLLVDGEVPADAADWAITFTLKADKDDADEDAIWQGTVGSGITAPDESTGDFTVTIPEGTTDGLTKEITFLHYDCEAVSPDGEVRATVQMGRYPVQKDVTAG